MKTSKIKTQNGKIITKITACCQVLEGMVFLGIDTEQFASMKKEYGGLQGLYTHIEKQLS